MDVIEEAFVHAIKSNFNLLALASLCLVKGSYFICHSVIHSVKFYLRLVRLNNACSTIVSLSSLLGKFSS